MNSLFELVSAATAALVDESGDTICAAWMFSERHAITAGHAVEDRTGETVHLKFGSDALVAATVLEEAFCKDDYLDYGVLEITGDLPARIPTLPLSLLPFEPGGAFTCGFGETLREKQTLELRVRGTVDEADRSGRAILAESNQTSERGFSGGPCVDQRTGAVIAVQSRVVDRSVGSNWNTVILTPIARVYDSSAVIREHATIISSAPSFESEFVTLCGRPAYLPTLLEATPFNYVYLCAIEKGRKVDPTSFHIARRTTNAGRVWTAMSPEAYIDTPAEALPGSSCGVVVEVDSHRANQVQLVRRVVEHHARGSVPSSLVVCMANERREGAISALEEVKRMFEGGDEESRKALCGTEFLVPTEGVPSPAPTPASGWEYATSRTRWRNFDRDTQFLIDAMGDASKAEDVVRIARAETSEGESMRYLLVQDDLSNPHAAFRREKAALLGRDSRGRQLTTRRSWTCDREGFRNVIGQGRQEG